MNITTEIANELKEKHGSNISDVILSNPEIQLYANHSLQRYQFCDRRFDEFSDVWKNKSFDGRIEFKTFILSHLKAVGDII